jgi:prepilin-type N-terminal cleavage/methylation domain-containing protein
MLHTKRGFTILEVSVGVAIFLLFALGVYSSWGGLMTTLAANQKANVAPQLYIFNSNTNNTGNRNDFRNMRFGLTSSLLTNNTYFAFDYGTNDHSQTWEYDEYNVKLGDPIAPPVSRNNEPAFKETDVWKREYSNGIALVNPTGQSQTVELGAEYEKIIGTQDKKVNDGAITDRVTLGAKDGIVMMKTLEGISSIKNTTFKNGSFLRFFDLKGNRARNGFFAFDKSYQGSATIYQGDLDGDGGEEKVVCISSMQIILLETCPVFGMNQGR